jgi:erythronate-4-phosphate dehydrogenase
MCAKIQRKIKNKTIYNKKLLLHAIFHLHFSSLISLFSFKILIFARNMKIVVDNKIPYIREKLALIADDVVYLPGAEITAADVRDADVLVVRTRTRCDERLLSGSSIRLVATATIGFDHIDTEYLQRAGIAWTNCPGCNSGSVAQYVESALLLLQRERGVNLAESTIGIVGCGHVGSKVLAVAHRLGMHTLVCDPPLEDAITHHPSSITHHPSSITHLPSFVPLDTIEREADIITFHVPLTRDDEYATWHLADDAFFRRLARVPYIINTSRGAVVDNDALLTALHNGRVRDAVIDVWEGEPHVNTELLQRVFIGTPHIAGYSADGKANADNMVIDAICRQFHLPNPGIVAPPQLPASFVYTGNPLELYNPMTDSDNLKREPQHFEDFRNNYPLRREKNDTRKN